MLSSFIAFITLLCQSGCEAMRERIKKLSLFTHRRSHSSRDFLMLSAFYDASDIKFHALLSRVWGVRDCSLKDKPEMEDELFVKVVVDDGFLLNDC